MPLVYANHTIHHGKGEVQAPGAVFHLDVEPKELKELLAREAIREPTEDEVKLHKLATGEYGEMAAAGASAPAKASAAPAADAKGASKPEDDIG